MSLPNVMGGTLSLPRLRVCSEIHELGTLSRTASSSTVSNPSRSRSGRTATIRLRFSEFALIGFMAMLKPISFHPKQAVERVIDRGGPHVLKNGCRLLKAQKFRWHEPKQATWISA